MSTDATANTTTSGTEDSTTLVTAAPDTSTTTTTDAGQTTTDQQPTGTETSTETKDSPAAVVPEKYEFVLPDGVEMDSTALELFEPLARENKLDQATAQKFVDVFAKVRQAEANKSVEQFRKTVEEWREQAMSHPEIDAVNKPENLKLAQDAVTKFGGDDLRKALNDSGFGNHPAFVLFCMKIGKAASQDTFITGGQTAAEVPAEQALFPTMFKKE